MERYILSGLIGAIIGACVTIWINRTNRKVAAIEKMLSVVYPIGLKSWREPDEGNPSRIFDENYSELWGSYAALYAALPWWRRKGIKKAWQKYIMPDYYDQIPSDDPAKIFQGPFYETTGEARRRSAEFVRYLMELRNKCI
jgi:hypothetical protein